MKRLSQKILITPCIMATLLFGFTAVESYADNLVQFSDLQYLGAFRVPDGANLNWGGRVPGYNPSGNPGSLFIGCLDTTEQIAEISIPTPVNSTNINALPTASLLQACANPAAGASKTFSDPNGVQVGGVLVYNGRLITSKFIYYDASYLQKQAFFVKPNTNLSQANATGAYAVSAPNIGYVDGGMALVPSNWQAALHGPVISSQCCLSIITRTSWGPDAFAWDPAQMVLANINTTISSRPLMYYDSSHATLGQWNGATPNNTTVWWNNAGIGYRSGGVIPFGTRSILFFGSQGTGSFCYGEAAACGDPCSTDKGTHGYPYQFQIMAFDLNNLAAVAAGTKQYYQPLPYAVWPLTGLAGLNSCNSQGGGATYDPTLKRIYFSANHGDGNRPLVYVWQVNTAGGASTPPTAPNTLQVQ